MTENSTHYATLGVSESAKPAAIKRAWSRQTAKEGPGSARLTELNAAAEVLLDPVRRAAYDAELAAARPAPTATPEDPSGAEQGTSSLRRAAMVLLPILTVGAIALAIILTLQSRERDASDRAATEALAVAQTSLKSVLSYDYRHLDQDRERATTLLTPALAKEFDKTYDELLAEGKGDTEGAAVQTKTVVTSDTVGAAVMDASPDEVTILAFVNQTSTHDGESPRSFANRVRVVLLEQDGKWLINELDPR
ncbi:MAG: hypothetical protein EOO74_03485 [Myxococcales bacterium]|nr:MAG: hypothetical protein EOO74_03485 [Myxococcales bacterium]